MPPDSMPEFINHQHVRPAYQPPASSTFLSDEPATSNQPAVLFSQNKPAPVISHQPTEQAAYLQHSFFSRPRLKHIFSLKENELQPLFAVGTDQQHLPALE
jgi:hypothetical protein